jgi:hypothetical protein
VCVCVCACVCVRVCTPYLGRLLRAAPLRGAGRLLRGAEARLPNACQVFPLYRFAAAGFNSKAI